MMFFAQKKSEAKLSLTLRLCVFAFEKKNKLCHKIHFLLKIRKLLIINLQIKNNIMPRPKSKSELIELSQNNYVRLLDLVNSYSKQDTKKEFPKGTLNRNITDVLAHLHEWHLMMLEWYNIGMKGQKPDMPAKGYTWKTLPDLNKKIWENYRNIKFEEAKNLLDKSYLEVQKLIKKHSNEELFEKKRYKWTGTTSLGAYLISNTSSHYDWGIKLIKKSMK